MKFAILSLIFLSMSCASYHNESDPNQVDPKIGKSVLDYMSPADKHR